MFLVAYWAKVSKLGAISLVLHVHIHIHGTKSCTYVYVRLICNFLKWLSPTFKSLIHMCILYIKLMGKGLWLKLDVNLMRVCVGLVRTCIGYTLGSQCIPGIYPRWFLITHEGVISKPPRVFPGIHGYLGYKQFVG